MGVTQENTFFFELLENKQFFIMLDSFGRKNQVDLQTLADMQVATNKEIKALLKRINNKE